MEAGCGITPIKYKNKSLVHGLQWAIGLEWYLMVNDPWQVVMSTDHPNGGSFLAYPQIIRMLMDRTYRADILKTCHPLVRERCQLGDLTREYTLNEIAIITRAGPARILGLKNKGHLGPGADADITIYTPHENKETMFELPRMVIKARPRHHRARRNARPGIRATRCTSRPNTTARSKATSRSGSKSITRSAGATTRLTIATCTVRRWCPPRPNSCPSGKRRVAQAFDRGLFVDSLDSILVRIAG